MQVINSYLKTFLVTVFLLAGYSLLSAQQYQAKLSHYSTENGLTSNAIAQLAQDDYGYIWIATWNGLARFDGYHFFNYQTGTMSHIPHLHNRVAQITIDNQQNVWMRMYDSRVFVMQRNIDSIIDPFEGITGSEEYRSSMPVVATSNGDVLVTIDGIGIYKMRLNNDGLSSQLITTGSYTVTSMAEGYQNDIWLGTNDGIHRMDASNMTVERKGIFTDEYITCLFSNGYNIFAGTKSGKIMSFSYGQEPVVIRSGGESIGALFVDSHNLIWFADSREGVSYYDPDTHVERTFSQIVTVPDVDSWGVHFSETSGGTVWMSMNHGGYGYYDRETQEVCYFHNDPSNPWNLSNTCNASLELNEGVVWESTSRRGLEKLEIMKNTIERRKLLPNSTVLLDNEIRGLFYDTRHKLLLMANKNNALFTIAEDGSRVEYTHSEDGTPLGRIYGISKGSNGVIWLSSKDYGLFKMTAKAGGGFTLVNFQHHDDDPNSLGDNHAYQTVEDNDGNIWIATYGGGVNMMPKGSTTFFTPKNKMKSYPRNSYQKVRTVALDKDGKVWAGTTDGILLLSYQDEHFTVDKLETSEEFPNEILHSNDVVCLARDNQGMMWIGTNGGGLSHTTGKDTQGRWLFENFGAKDGLPSEEIRSLTFDRRGSVWFATENVLCSFDTGKRIFSTFSTLEGVDETMCSEGSAISLPNGNLIFGTINGYYYVDRDKLVNTTGTMLKLRITDFWVDDVLQSPRLTRLYKYYVPDAKEVEMPSRNSIFAIRFASLNYQLQHRVHYQYKLEGYDHNWVNAGKDRTATYEGVPAGTYRFFVRAFLLESPEKYDQKEITITVPPLFMLSKNAIWFYMLLIATFGLSLLFLRQRYLKNRSKNAAKKNVRGETQSESQQLVTLFDEWIANRYAVNDLTLDEFLTSVQMNRANFEETLRDVTGMSPRDYINMFRIGKAKEMLEQTSDSVADISFNCGFSDPMQFNRLFNAKTGMTPSQYRDKCRAEGETDSYEIIE
jgi:ligand-binding sensor domain-containing protein/AraC-like DNA-binding protein